MIDYTGELISRIEAHLENNRGELPTRICMSAHSLEIIKAETAQLSLTPEGVEASPGLKVERDAAGHVLFEGVRVVIVPFMINGRFEMWL